MIVQSDTSIAQGIEQFLDWLKRRLHVMLLPQNGVQAPLSELKPLARPFLKHLNNEPLETREVLALWMALLPHVQPHAMDALIHELFPQGGDFAQLGGVRGKNHRGFLPTGETIVFLLAGSDVNKRFQAMRMFEATHFFQRKNIVWLGNLEPNEPKMSGRLVLAQDYLDLFTFGIHTRPAFSLEFPAQYIDTDLEWEDLVLRPETLEQVQELETWLKHGQALLYDWGMRKRLKLGYRSLLHGPPGTGKTLTASLLGKYTHREVYKVDLSMVVSKFIGETEKNLSNLFARAENKGWILFFDEADALFGKRTNVRDAHDKYANQEVAYLLQRVENYDGLVILASNFKSNIDEAFIRRFQSIIHFPLPGGEERFQLWQKAFPAHVQAPSLGELKSFAAKHELSGADIMNVVQYACLQALKEGRTSIEAQDISKGIRREFIKSGKIV